MRTAFLMGVLGLTALAGVTVRSALSERVRTVPCAESIDSTKFPYIGSREPKFRYRQVLGVVSVPPAFLAQIVPTHTRPWAYWRKAGLVIRTSGEAVTISVPEGWRGRAAIAWGYGGHGVFSSLRIAGCHVKPTRGFAYSGGFYLRSRSACLPLIFRVRNRSKVVRFGLGERCR